jgi:sugar phosphate permease
MDKEIKELLEKEIKSVKQSRLKVIVGVGLLIANIVLLLMGILDISTLIFTLILLFSVWSIVMDHGINKSVLVLMRYIVDEEYAKEFDKKNEK